MGWFDWVVLWVEVISHKTRDATPCSCSNPAEYFNIITFNMIVLVQLWVAGEGPTIEWSHLPRRIVSEKRLSFLLRQKILGNI